MPVGGSGAGSSNRSVNSTPQRRLGVDDVHVAELGERDDRHAHPGSPRGGEGAEVGADQV